MTGIPPHYVHVYERPVIGSHFITRKQVNKYRHQKIAVGGDDTMSCEISMTPTESEIALENWVGSRVAVYVDNPAQPIWEGLITRVYINIGGLMISRSLDEMFNRVEIIFVNGVGGNTTIAASNELDSQAIYGVKTGTADGFVTRGSAGSTPMMTALRNLLIAQVAWPFTTIQQGGKIGVVRIEAKGFYHTFKWEKYTDTSTGSDSNIATYIGRVLTALVNGDTFIDNTDTSQVQSNTSHTVDRGEIFGKTAWQVLQKVQGAGDGSNYYVLGVTPTSSVTGKRVLYYRPSRTDVYYTTRAADGLQVRYLYGGKVRPWTMEADRTIRIQDILIGWGGRGIDPRETYIETVRYDADKQTVTWAGNDDIHLQGALQTQRYFKFHDTNFGANIRQNWS